MLLQQLPSEQLRSWCLLVILVNWELSEPKQIHPFVLQSINASYNYMKPSLLLASFKIPPYKPLLFSKMAFMYR